MTGDAAGFAGEDRLARLRVARQLPPGGGAPAGRGGAHGRRNVVQRDVHRPAERLEERGECPNLRAVEAYRRLVHLGHDVRVALDDIGTGLEERLEDVLLGAHAGLGLARACADPGQVGRAGALLADPVADLAAALGVEDLLARLHELPRRESGRPQPWTLVPAGVRLPGSASKTPSAPAVVRRRDARAAPAGPRELARAHGHALL